MLKTATLPELIKRLELNIEKTASSFEKVAPSLSLANAQRWRFDLRKDGEPVISRRYKDKAGKFARQTFPLDSLTPFGVDKKDSAELQKFLDRLNSAINSMRSNATYEDMKLAWIDKNVLKAFEAWYGVRVVEDETSQDILHTLRTHLIPFWKTLPNIDPSQWHTHKSDFANYILVPRQIDIKSFYT